jgi:hypothetical protein
MYRLCTLFTCAGILLLPAGSAVAGTDTTGAWKKSLVIDITATQASYSDSWAGGEAGNLSWAANLNGSAERQLKARMNLKSALRLSFGQTLTQDADTKDWGNLKKSTDLVDWETVSRFTVDFYVDPYAAFRLESQFLDASFDRKKRYFNPLKLTESVGAARRFYEKENDNITSRLGLALRQTLREVVIDSVLLTTEDSTLTDGGLESVTDVVLTLNDKMTYTGKLTLYKALYFSKKDDVKGTPYEDDWKAVDVNWENIIAASLSKIITVNLYTQVLYDKEVSRKGRFKETLAIGFVFKML